MCEAPCSGRRGVRSGCGSEPGVLGCTQCCRVYPLVMVATGCAWFCFGACFACKQPDTRLQTPSTDRSCASYQKAPAKVPHPHTKRLLLPRLLPLVCPPAACSSASTAAASAVPCCCCCCHVGRLWLATTTPPLLQPRQHLLPHSCCPAPPAAAAAAAVLLQVGCQAI